MKRTGRPASLPNVKELEAAVPRWLDSARQVIPAEAVRLDMLLNELPACFTWATARTQGMFPPA